MWFFSDEARLIISCISGLCTLGTLTMMIILVKEVFKALRLANFVRLTQPTREELKAFQLKYGEAERKKLEAQLREIFEKKP